MNRIDHLDTFIQNSTLLIEKIHFFFGSDHRHRNNHRNEIPKPNPKRTKNAIKKKQKIMGKKYSLFDRCKKSLCSH